MELAQQLEGFELKLRQLSAKMKRQSAENASLRTENQGLKKELDRQQAIISGLKEKLAQSATSAAALPTASAVEAGDRATIQSQLDFCLAEVDKCLAWLQTH